MTSEPAELGWTRFYMEFADKLLLHRDDRSGLVEAVLGVSDRQSLTRSLSSDGSARDICPFAAMGAFSGKNAIAAELGEFLGVSEPAPESFDGVGRLWYLTLFFRGDYRSVDDVDTLWQVFADAIEYADTSGSAAKQSFIESYDRASQVKGTGRTLTLGLYWTRPYSYPALDKAAERYLSGVLGIDLPRRMPPPGSEYLEIADTLKERFADADSTVSSFPALSVAASERRREERETEDEPPTPKEPEITADEFEWTRYYMEFADELLRFRDRADRGPLVEEVKRVCESLNFGYLSRDPDICPFTIVGSFSRAITEGNRRVMMNELGSFLGVNTPTPTSFDGAPTLPNTNSKVFRNDPEAGWGVFADAMEYAATGSKRARQRLANSYDQGLSVKGVASNLTMGLFWTRPHTYPALDRKSKQYITDILGMDLPPRALLPSGEEYLDLADELRRRFQDDDFPVHSFQELTLAAQASMMEDEPEEEAEQPQQEAPETGYTIQSVIDDGCFVETAKLEMILEQLRAKKNLVLQGPTGTGKSWLARRLAFALIGEEDGSRVRRVQFHENMSYEDFVRRPHSDAGGGQRLTDGLFLEMVFEAERDPDNVYVMVIEEINRGDQARIFGETLTLLESDKRNPNEAVALAKPRFSGERVHVSPNVYVIGTMNAADRSSPMADLPLRRRFAFVDLDPSFGDAWRNWVHEQCGVDLGFLADVERRMTALNDRISYDAGLGPQFRVGHSAVTPEPGASISDPAAWFASVVETEIGPLLRAYWFDATEKAESAKRNLLAGL